MLISGLPEHVSDDEDLARFLPFSNLFSAQKEVVKPSAFLPTVKDRETSVFRHGIDPLGRLFSIGDENAAGERRIPAAAVVKAADVRSAQLDVIADEPPPLHAAIRGWPWLDGDPDLQKAQQKERAAEIASKAVLVRR